MIHIVPGDLVLVPRGIIAHQTNILGIANSGLVMDIKDCFTGWYQDYKSLCDQFKEQRNVEGLLGTTQYYRVRDGLYVANLFAQFSIKPFNRNTDLVGFRTALTHLEDQARQVGLPVYMSNLIACVRGGMDWEAEIYPIIEDVFSQSPVDLFLVDYQKGLVP